jgi:hypothetical protein
MISNANEISSRFRISAEIIRKRQAERFIIPSYRAP